MAGNKIFWSLAFIKTFQEISWCCRRFWRCMRSLSYSVPVWAASKNIHRHNHCERWSLEPTWHLQPQRPKAKNGRAGSKALFSTQLFLLHPMLPRHLGKSTLRLTVHQHFGSFRFIKTIICRTSDFPCVCVCACVGVQVCSSPLSASDGGHVGSCSDSNSVIHHDILL